MYQKAEVPRIRDSTSSEVQHVANDEGPSCQGESISDKLNRNILGIRNDPHEWENRCISKHLHAMTRLCRLQKV